MPFGAELDAVSGLLPAPEGGPVVHGRDAVGVDEDGAGLEPAGDVVGHGLVAGPDGGAQAEGSGVGPVDGLVQSPVAEYGEGGGELLVAHDGGVVVGAFDDGRGDQVAAGAGVLGPDTGRPVDPGPGRFGLGQHGLHPVAGLGPVNGAHGDLVGQAVADHLGSHPGHQRLDHDGDLVLGDVEPLDGHADLAARDEGGFHDLDARAASISTSGAMMAGSLPPSSRTTGVRPSEAPAMTARPVGTPPVNETMSTSRVGHQGLAELGTGTVHRIHHPGGEGLGQGRRHRQHGTGAGGRGLHHHRVPGQQGRQQLVTEDGDGPVEGQDGGHHPVGDALDRGPPTTAPVMVRAARASAARGAKAPAIPPMVPASNWASHRTFPCSRVSNRARSDEPTTAPAAAAALPTSSARSSCDNAAQAGAARRAAATARSTWATDADGPSRTTSAGRTGLVTG